MKRVPYKPRIEGTRIKWGNGENKDALRHGALTGTLRGLIFQTRNGLSSGWDEEIYHQVLVHLLQEKGIPVVSKPRRMLWHRGIEVHQFEPDIVVWDKIVLELKALPYQDDFSGEQIGQLINYLKFWQMDLGLLINFGPPKVTIKRILWDEPELALAEKYDDIQPYMTENDKVALRQIRQHILAIGQQYGLGYPETIYRRLIAIEIAYHGLECIGDVGVTPVWTGCDLPRQVTQQLQVAGKYLICVRAFATHPHQFDFVATKTYLRLLGLAFGLVVNFGRKELQIFGVKAN